MANVVSHSVAAGIVSAGGSWDRKSARKANDAYSQMLHGLMARSTGYIGKTHDAQGRAIAPTLGAVRDWLVQKKIIRKVRQ